MMADNHDDTLSLAELLSALIQIPSVFEQEHAILDFVTRQLDQLGLPVVKVAFDAERLTSLPGAQPPFSLVAGRHNLVARYPGRGGGRSLVLNCHLDVVPGGSPQHWTHPPFSGHMDHAANLVYGRGAMDDKAGVTLALGVLRRLVAEAPPLSGDVIVHFVLEDEATGNGSLLCIEDGHGGDGAIILDGTRGDKAISQHAGNLQFSLSVKGRPASVSVSHMGCNAAEALMAFLLHLRDKILALNSGRAQHWAQFPSPNQCVTQSINATAQPLTVPDSAEAMCYMTFTPPHTVESMRRYMEAEVSDFAARHQVPDMTIHWQGWFAAEPVMSPCAELERVIQAALHAVGRPSIPFGPSTGTSDLRHFAARNIPCVLFGPGRGFNPHRADEHFHLDDLEPMVTLLTDIVRRWTA
jgi:acetylornithine deacetylase